jgi:hypothetical protein
MGWLSVNYNSYIRVHTYIHYLILQSNGKHFYQVDLSARLQLQISACSLAYVNLS